MSEKTIILTLPSESPLVLIQTQPSLAISCLISKTKRRVLIDYNKGRPGHVGVAEADVDVPDLLWTQLFTRWKYPHNDSGMCSCFKCSFRESTRQIHRAYKGSSNFYRFFVNAIDTEKCQEAVVWAANYNLANIDNGYVCWGSIDYPCSLKIAHNSYWQSVLNNSPSRYPVDIYGNATKQLVEFIQKYKPVNWQNFASFITGTKFISTNDQPTGVFISLDPQYAVGHEQNYNEASIGFAFLSENGWKVKCGAAEFEVPADKVTVK